MICENAHTAALREQIQQTCPAAKSIVFTTEPLSGGSTYLVVIDGARGSSFTDFETAAGVAAGMWSPAGAPK